MKKGFLSLLLGAFVLLSISACNKDDDAGASNLRIELVNTDVTVGEVLPAGCTSGTGYSATTGQPCVERGTADFLVTISMGAREGRLFMPTKAASFEDSEACTVTVFKGDEPISKSVPVEFILPDSLEKTAAGNIEIVAGIDILVTFKTIVDNSYLESPGIYHVAVTRILWTEKDDNTFENVETDLPDLVSDGEYLK